MPLVNTVLFVSLLASAALAAPKHGMLQHKHLHHKHATGTGTGYPYGPGNSTGYYPTGTGTGHHHHHHTGTGTGSYPLVYSTVTVLPLPATTNTPAAYTDAVNAAGAGADSGSSPACGTLSTYYVTAASTVTVTVDGSAPSAPTPPYGAGNSTAAYGPTGSDGPTAYPSYVMWTSPLVNPGAASSTAAAAAASGSTSTTLIPVDTAPAPAPSTTTSTTSTTTSTTTATPTSPAAVASVPAAPPGEAAPVIAQASTTTKTTTKKTTSTTAAVKTTTTAAAAVAATTAKASTTAAAAAAPPSGAKRGLVYNTASLCAPFASSTAISWAYNWDSSSAGLSSKLEFVPMIWGLNGQQNGFTSNVETAISTGSKYVMAFNEPDEESKYGGSALSPGDAATGYQTYMMPFKGKALLGAPAVTNANSTSPLMGIPWLRAFDTACNGACHYDFVPLHWYGWPSGTAAQQAKAFQDYVTAAKAEVGGKPIWVTEFSAMPLEQQDINSAFMDIVLPWLDGQDSGVDRYSYFMVTSGSLVSGSSLTQMGTTYLNS